MEYIKKEELIIGEIYKSHYEGQGDYIFIKKENLKNNTFINISRFCKLSGDFRNENGFYEYLLATSEEKHWLLECIRLDKFIEFEEAMKTFIPEYIEILSGYFVEKEEIGKIYKISDKFPSHLKYCEKYDWNDFLKHKDSFKPSTKEAYDAQFVVIEPLPQFKIIETIETITKVENNEGNQFFIGDVVISSNGTIQTIESFDYNKAKTNIIAFTNKQSILGNGIGIDKIEHYIEPKVEVEETLLDKAKKLYPVGTKFINPNGNRECVIKEKGNYFEGNNHNIYHSIAKGVFKYEEGLSGCIYINNTWSKIIE